MYARSHLVFGFDGTWIAHRAVRHGGVPGSHATRVTRLPSTMIAISHGRNFIQRKGYGKLAYAGECGLYSLAQGGKRMRPLRVARRTPGRPVDPSVRYGGVNDEGGEEGYTVV